MKWLRALRLAFLTTTLAPILLGAAISWKFYSFDWLLFILVLVGVELLHLGTNLINDYYDQKNDSVNKNHNPFSGGSRVIQKGLIRPGNIRNLAITFFILGMIMGTIISALTSSVVPLIFGLIGAFSGYYYTASPLKLGYRGLGELLILINFGPVIVMGTVVSISQVISLEAFLLSLPLGILMAAILIINEFPDREADQISDKKNIVVRLGKEKSLRIFNIALILSFILIPSYVLLNLLDMSILIVLLTLPLSLYIMYVSKNMLKKDDLRVNKMTIMLHNLLSLLLIIGVLL